MIDSAPDSVKDGSGMAAEGRMSNRKQIERMDTYVWVNVLFSCRKNIKRGGREKVGDINRNLKKIKNK